MCFQSITRKSRLSSRTTCMVAGILLTQVWRPNGNVGIVSRGKKKEKATERMTATTTNRAYSSVTDCFAPLCLSVCMIYMYSVPPCRANTAWCKQADSHKTAIVAMSVSRDTFLLASCNFDFWGGWATVNSMLNFKCPPV